METVRISDIFGKNILKNVLRANPNHRTAIHGTCKETQRAKEIVHKEAITEVLEKYPLKAIFPSVPSHCIRATMENYRRFVHQHNKKIALQNSEIQDFNQKVDDFIAQGELTLVQQKFGEVFRNKNGNFKKQIVFNHQTQQDEIQTIYQIKAISNKEIKNYNQKAQEFCNDYGFIAKKKELQPIKAQTEKVFQQILFCYNMQMYQLNKHYIKLGITKEKSLPKVDLHTEEIKHLNKESNIKMLDLSSRTIKRHIERLLDAGILQNYLFLGTNRPPKTHINPDILVYFDEKTSKTKNDNNQLVKSEKATNCHHSKEITRTNKKKEKEEVSEQVENSQIGVASPSALQPVFSFFTRTPQSNQDGNSSAAPPRADEFSRWKAPKNPQTRPEKLSDFLQKQILNPQELAQRLTNGDFNNYTPLDIRYFEDEAMYGFLTADEFRELFFNDLIKNSAKLFKDKEVYIGCWLNTIYNFLFSKSFTVNGFAFNKRVLCDYIKQYRWRLEYARRWFVRHSEIKILFPSDYFDMNRKTSKEVGFTYTRKAWQNHLKAKEKAQQRNEQKRYQASKGNTSKSTVQLINYKINAFFKNEITYEKLYDYVKHNHPTFLEKLPDYVNKKTIKNRKIITQDQ